MADPMSTAPETLPRQPDRTGRTLLLLSPVLCALAVLIALVTVSYQSIKAATADPVKSLRYE